MRYDAFLSYSHVDVLKAAAVHRALERFAKRWYQRRALTLFRDAQDLSASGALWLPIQSALEQARFLVLLCSPHSAASAWVAKEVDWWLANRPADRMLLVLCDGTASWNDSVSDFEWGTSNAVSPVLSGKYKQEPVWVDMGWGVTQEDLTLI
jgi:hypothetical protein